MNLGIKINRSNKISISILVKNILISKFNLRLQYYYRYTRI